MQHALSTPRLVDRIRALRRRLRPFLIAVAIGCAATLALTVLWPATYRSSAVILIEQQEIPQDLVRSTITSYADQRIQVISQRVMTTANLLDIVHRYGLYRREQKSETREKLIERMRGDIHMNMISADVIDPRSGRPTQATIAFSVSYDSRSPDLALKVANELTTLYLNENLTSRTRLTRDTARFLAQEGDRIQQEITTLEQKLAVFKQQHVDNLPELAQLNFQLVDRAEEELRETDTRIRSLQEQTTYLEAQLAQISPTSQLFTATGERILSSADRLKTLRTQLASLSGVYAPDHPDVVRARREIEGLEREVGRADPTNDLRRRLSQAETELAQAREKYSADHPDVIRLQRAVDGIQAAITGASAAGANVSAQASVARAADDTPDNPAYIQIRAQLEGSRNEMRSLEAKRTELKANIAAFDRKLAQSPAIERDYRALTRDYENARLKYQQTRSKQTEAELAQNLESDRKGERFTMIEPPLPAEEPVTPNRLMILVLGLLLSLGAGIGTVLALDAFDTTVKTRGELADLLERAPLAVIPTIRTAADEARGRLQRRYALFAGAGTFLALIVAVHVLYRPLDVLWFAALRRLGA